MRVLTQKLSASNGIPVMLSRLRTCNRKQWRRAHLARTILSKPQGPIQRWLDKVGDPSSRSSEELIPTAELPKPEPEAEPEPEHLFEQEIEISIADTMPLPPEMAAQFKTESHTDEEKMESKVVTTENAAAEIASRGGSGPLLDLGEFEPAQAAAEEDFVLDLDLDEEPASSPVSVSAATSSGYQAAQLNGAAQVAPATESAPVAEANADLPTVDPMAETQEMIRPVGIRAPSVP